MTSMTNSSSKSFSHHSPKTNGLALHLQHQLADRQARPKESPRGWPPNAPTLARRRSIPQITRQAVQEEIEEDVDPPPIQISSSEDVVCTGMNFSNCDTPEQIHYHQFQKMCFGNVDMQTAYSFCVATIWSQRIAIPALAFIDQRRPFGMPTYV